MDKKKKTFKIKEAATGFTRQLTLSKKRSKGPKVTQMADV